MLKNFMFVNNDGASIEIDGSDIKLVNGLDLSGTENQISFTETNFDGAFVQNERLAPKTIEMELQLRKKDYSEADMDQRRMDFYKILTPKKNPITLYFENDLKKKFYIEFHLTSTPIMSPDKSNYNAAFQRALVQGMMFDPYVYDTEPTVVNLKETIAAWEFDWEIIDGQTILSSENPTPENIAFVDADSELGFEAEINILADDIEELEIQNFSTGQRMKIEGMTFSVGDLVLFNTNRRNKRVILIREGLPIDITRNLTYDSTFFQLQPGDNDISVSTGDTTDANGIILFRNKYTGV